MSAARMSFHDGAIARCRWVDLLGLHSIMPRIRDQIWAFIGSVQQQLRLPIAFCTVLPINSHRYLVNVDGWTAALDDAGRSGNRRVVKPLLGRPRARGGL